MDTWRLILSQDNDAYTNMAVDEALMQTYIYKERVPILRFYRWHPAAISIGVAQKPDKVLRLSTVKRDNVDFVRRMTGGEAIFHKDEITYSIICCKRDLNLSDSVERSFRTITNFLVNAYRELGLKPHYAGDRKEYAHGGESPVCFATREKFDIIINDKKLGGNAQKRVSDFIFQHGSIPLCLNFEAMKRYFVGNLDNMEKMAISLEEALGTAIRADECIKHLKESFKKTFSVKLIKSFLSEKEQNLVYALREEKYDTKQWNYLRRTKIMKNKNMAE
jgi:lipoate-protein ligase A